MRVRRASLRDLILIDGNVLPVDVPNVHLLAQFVDGQPDGHRPDVEDRRTIGRPSAIVVALATASAALVDDGSLKVLIERGKRNSMPTILKGEE
jgi:hypothetical protein